MCYPITMCWLCAHAPANEAKPSCCKAFPDEIPAGILSGEVDHRRPLAEDGGIIFQSIEARGEAFINTTYAEAALAF